MGILNVRPGTKVKLTSSGSISAAPRHYGAITISWSNGVSTVGPMTLPFNNATPAEVKQLIRDSKPEDDYENVWTPTIHDIVGSLAGNDEIILF